MEVRKQVQLSNKEVKNILIEYLLKQGLQVKEDTLKINSDGSVFILTATDEEVWVAGTMIILAKSISLLELNNQKLKEKLLARLSKETEIGSLLQYPSIKDAKFKTENTITFSLFENSRPKKRDGLTSEEEKILIDTFSDLGIRLTKRLP